MGFRTSSGNPRQFNCRDESAIKKRSKEKASIQFSFTFKLAYANIIFDSAKTSISCTEKMFQEVTDYGYSDNSSGSNTGRINNSFN